MPLFRASTIKRTRSRKDDSTAAAEHTASTTKRSRSPAKRSSTGRPKSSTALKRATTTTKSAAIPRAAKGGRSRRASVDETASTVEHKAAHDRLINLVASAIKELGRYTRKGVSRPKIRQWMEEHLEKEVGTAQFRRAMSQAKALGLIEQLVQRFFLTDKAKKEMKMNLVVGSKQAEEAIEGAETETEEEPAAKKASVPRKRAPSKAAGAKRGRSATTRSRKATAGGGGGSRARSTTTKKRAASAKSSGERAKKAKTSTA